MTTRTPAEVLQESRRRDSQAKRGKVLAILDEMVRRGDPVSFAAVARGAGVSHWLVYAEGLREHIEAARTQQTGKARRDRQAGLNPSAASLTTDLELARADNSKLRAERDQLKAALQRRLGEQLDQLSNQSLIDRVDELTQHNQQLAAETTRLQEANSTLRDSLQEAEEDLAGARAALRRLMHQKNITGDPAG
jgi:predicted RNase H-like nuclease (RuvC/YqgF family)